MLDTSIITGKAWTGNPSASNSIKKRLYIKVFPGEFWYRAPRAKKAKIYGGELFVRYSNREWPEKKNGPLAGDPGLLSGISELLRSLNLQYADDLYWAKVQHELKETLTLTAGSELAKEIVDRGWARLIEIKEPTLPKETEISIVATPTQSPKSEIITIGEVVEMTVDNPPVVSPLQPIYEGTNADSMSALYSKKKSTSKKKPTVDK
jgi:hypothetical protein